MAELLSYSQAAAVLCCSVSGLRKLVARRAVRAVVIGHRTVRFRPADLDRFIASRVREDVLAR